MKKNLLIALLLGACTYITAQVCTPNSIYADSVFGIWTENGEDLPPIIAGIAYNEVLNLKFPTDANEIESSLPVGTVTLDSVVLTGIAGLPNNLTYTCNTSNCSWAGGDQGCIVISGISNNVGQYPLTINIQAWVVFYSNPVSYPYAFSDYTAEVQAPNSISSFKNYDFQLSQNSPNPFKDITEININTAAATDMEVKVFNVLGKEVMRKSVMTVKGNNSIAISAANLPSGIYMYQISDGKQSITKKMIVRK